jgi:hypothetical protein
MTYEQATCFPVALQTMHNPSTPGPNLRCNRGTAGADGLILEIKSRAPASWAVGFAKTGQGTEGSRKLPPDRKTPAAHRQFRAVAQRAERTENKRVLLSSFPPFPRGSCHSAGVSPTSAAVLGVRRRIIDGPMNCVMSAGSDLVVERRPAPTYSYQLGLRARNARCERRRSRASCSDGSWGAPRHFVLRHQACHHLIG